MWSSFVASVVAVHRVGWAAASMATWLTARVDSDVEAWVLPSGVVRVVNGVVVWRLWLVYALCGDCRCVGTGAGVSVPAGACANGLM